MSVLKVSDTAAGWLQESCCQGQHTYLHAQLMLTRLGRLPRGARFRRLSQELELDAAKQHGRIVWQMHFWCVLASAGSQLSFRSALMGAFLELFKMFEISDPLLKTLSDSKFMHPSFVSDAKHTCTHAQAGGLCSW